MIMGDGHPSLLTFGLVLVTLDCRRLIVGIRVVVIDLPAHGRSGGRYALLFLFPAANCKSCSYTRYPFTSKGSETNNRIRHQIRQSKSSTPTRQTKSLRWGRKSRRLDLPRIRPQSHTKHRRHNRMGSLPQTWRF